jgi:hypothetical protein
LVDQVRSLIASGAFRVWTFCASTGRPLRPDVPARRCGTDPAIMDVQGRWVAGVCIGMRLGLAWL